MFSVGFPEIALLLYVIVVLGMAIFVLSLGLRFVRATERIAAALEQRPTPMS